MIIMSGQSIVEFNVQPIELVPDDELIFTDCNCEVPTQLKLIHNLGLGGLFYHFLYRNDLTLDQELLIYFNGTEWITNRHLLGLAPDSEVVEDWNVVMDWSCTSNVGGYDLGSAVWKFGLSVKRKTGSKSQDTRIMVTFSPLGTCFEGVMNFKFKVNSQTMEAISDPRFEINDIVFHDGIGMFKHPYYAKNPFLNFGISLNQNSRGLTRLDQGINYPPYATYPEK